MFDIRRDSIHNFSRDGQFRPSPRIGIPISSQWMNENRTTIKLWVYLLIPAAIILIGYNWWYSQQGKAPAAPEVNPAHKRVEKIVYSEETILELTPLLREMAAQWPELSIPQTFDPTENSHPLANLPFVRISEHNAYPVGMSRMKIQPDTRFSGSFHIVEGKALSPESFRTVVKFERKWTGASGEITGIKSLLEVDWLLSDKSLLEVDWLLSDNTWQHSAWKQTFIRIIQSPGLLFTDQLDHAIPDLETRKQLQKSSHQEKLIEFLRTGIFILPESEFAGLVEIASASQYPAISVVDIDRDGWDDLFITSRWGPTQLLRNKGNGTFEDITKASGLIIEGCCNCALFADYDRDGDLDVFIGRTLYPSQYYENNEGHFEIKKQPYGTIGFVVSASAVDVNRDGLLDLYLSTYGPAGEVDLKWIERFIRPEDRQEIIDRKKTSDRYLDHTGPANVLLINRGDHFTRAPRNEALDQWHNTYGATWADFDQDGDPDVYISNDFAPDALVRNDTPKGSMEPVFTDVSDDMFPKGYMGFGMGSSWGDANNDGRIDLYISNMYSKAGKRIVKQVGDADPRIALSAKGNALLLNTENGFQSVENHTVQQVGWSFGGQFADYDNNGHLDLYVPSGYFSPPKEVETEVDL
jgi:hypothetical protein